MKELWWIGVEDGSGFAVRDHLLEEVSFGNQLTSRFVGFRTIMFTDELRNVASSENCSLACPTLRTPRYTQLCICRHKYRPFSLLSPNIAQPALTICKFVKGGGVGDGKRIDIRIVIT